jgi:hypothetical protein
MRYPGLAPGATTDGERSLEPRRKSNVFRFCRRILRRRMNRPESAAEFQPDSLTFGLFHQGILGAWRTVAFGSPRVTTDSGVFVCNRPVRVG